MFGKELCRIFGVRSFVHSLAIVSSPDLRDAVKAVKVDPSIPPPQLREQLRRKHHSRDLPGRDEVQVSPMGKFPKPMVVGLLVEQGCHR